MSTTYPTPSLTAHTTVSHPRDDIRVLGFTGRDTIYGRDVLILKAETLPTTENLVGVPLDEEYTHGRHIYVIGDEVVYVLMEDDGDYNLHTFDEWETYGRITCAAIPWDNFETFDEDEVGVTL